MPKRTRLEALSNAEIDSSNIQESTDEGEKNSKRRAAAQNSGDDDIQNLPAELRALLRTLKPRFLPEREFNRQIQLLPHELSLEILDCLEALPVFGSRGTQTFLDSKQFMGRFKNTTDRRFILIRRNLEVDALMGSQALASTSRWSSGGSEEQEQAFKRSLAALLRSARHIHFIASYSNRLTIQFLSARERAFLEAFGSLVQRAQARFKQLRNVHISLSSQLDGSSENYLLPFVTKVTILENLAGPIVHRLLRMMPKLCCFVCSAKRFDWSSVPLSTLRELTIQSYIDVSSWIYILQESKQLKFLSLDLSANSFTACADIKREILSHVSADSLRISLRLGKNTFLRELDSGSMTQLTHLSFDRSYEKYDDDDAAIARRKTVKTMNQRGQLLSLRIFFSRENKLTREWLESIGIGHSNCALRTLQFEGEGSYQCEPDVFVPILNCPRLENFSATFGMNSTVLLNLESILQERGLLLNIEFFG